MSETLVTKRLHVSGLTPAITAKDIQQRLTTFGTVKAVDGFGLLDGVGQPRKFGYVTIETTSNKLAKCMNLLSGSTWKGAKLRIGEAKPDYAERIRYENEDSEEPPKKKRRRFGAVHAEDMSPVTPENVAERAGWKVTPLGRILRPMRMRPEKPLPPVLESAITKTTKDKKKAGPDKPKKKRVKEPDTRARKRTIDVLKWGSTQLKGMFLELDVPNVKTTDVVRDIEMERPALTSDSEDESVEDADDEAETTEVPVTSAEAPKAKPMESAPKPTSLVPTSPPATLPLEPSSPPMKVAQEPDADIMTEKSKSLGLLASLFSGNDNDDWVGRESVGSDIDEESLLKRDQMVAGDDDVDYEIVPIAAAARKSSAIEVDRDSDEEPEEEILEHTAEKQPVHEPKQATKLKDLFAPREEEGGFSLLGHLDLDLELDEEIPFSTEHAVPKSIPETLSITPISLTSLYKSHNQPAITLNHKQALFFPLSKDSQLSTKARPKDLFDLAKEDGWNWRDPKVGFYKTATEEEIRKEWEEAKGDLTQDWKRRWREAGKVSRRRGRPAGDAEGE